MKKERKRNEMMDLDQSFRRKEVILLTLTDPEAFSFANIPHHPISTLLVILMVDICFKIPSKWLVIFIK